MKSQVPYKFNEGDIADRLKEYLDTTYSGHYQTDENIQAVDVWEALGNLETSCRDNAIKYLMRFGKKDGKNVKDLFKAMHYLVLMVYAVEKENATTSSK